MSGRPLAPSGQPVRPVVALVSAPRLARALTISGAIKRRIRLSGLLHSSPALHGFPLLFGRHLLFPPLPAGKTPTYLDIADIASHLPIMSLDDKYLGDEKRYDDQVDYVVDPAKDVSQSDIDRDLESACIDEKRLLRKM